MSRKGPFAASGHCRGRFAPAREAGRTVAAVPHDQPRKTSNSDHLVGIVDYARIYAYEGRPDLPEAQYVTWPTGRRDSS